MPARAYLPGVPGVPGIPGVPARTEPELNQTRVQFGLGLVHFWFSTAPPLLERVLLNARRARRTRRTRRTSHRRATGVPGVPKFENRIFR